MVTHDLQYLKTKLPDQVRNLIYISPLGNISEEKFQQYSQFIQKNEEVSYVEADIDKKVSHTMQIYYNLSSPKLAIMQFRFLVNKAEYFRVHSCQYEKFQPYLKPRAIIFIVDTSIDNDVFSIISEFNELKSSDSFKDVGNKYLFLFGMNSDINEQDSRIFQFSENDNVNSIRSSFTKIVQNIFFDLLTIIENINDYLYEVVEYLPIEIDPPSKLPTKRAAHRAKKILGDYGLLLGFKEDSLVLYRSVIESAKKTNDYLFSGSVCEGIAVYNYVSNNEGEAVNQLMESVKFYMKVGINMIYFGCVFKMIYCYMNYSEYYYFDILTLIEDTRYKYEIANEIKSNNHFDFISFMFGCCDIFNELKAYRKLLLYYHLLFESLDQTSNEAFLVLYNILYQFYLIKKSELRNDRIYIPIWKELLLYLYEQFHHLIPSNMIDMSIHVSLYLLNISDSSDLQLSYAEYIKEKSVFISESSQMFNGCDFIIIKSFLPQPVQSPIKIEQVNNKGSNPFLYNPFESRISKEPLKWVKNEKNTLIITLYNSLKLSISMSKISLQDENNNFPFIIEPISPITLSSESTTTITLTLTPTVEGVINITHILIKVLGIQILCPLHKPYELNVTEPLPLLSLISLVDTSIKPLPGEWLDFNNKLQLTSGNYLISLNIVSDIKTTTTKYHTVIYDSKNQDNNINKDINIVIENPKDTDGISTLIKWKYENLLNIISNNDSECDLNFNILYGSEEFESTLTIYYQTDKVKRTITNVSVYKPLHIIKLSSLSINDINEIIPNTIQNNFQQTQSTTKTFCSVELKIENLTNQKIELSLKSPLISADSVRLPVLLSHSAVLISLPYERKDRKFNKILSLYDLYDKSIEFDYIINDHKYSIENYQFHIDDIEIFNLQLNKPILVNRYKLYNKKSEEISNENTLGIYNIKQYETYKLEIQLENTELPFVIDIITPETPQLLLQGKSHIIVDDPNEIVQMSFMCVEKATFSIYMHYSQNNNVSCWLSPNIELISE